MAAATADAKSEKSAALESALFALLQRRDAMDGLCQHSPPDHKELETVSKMLRSYKDNLAELGRCKERLQQLEKDKEELRGIHSALIKQINTFRLFLPALQRNLDATGFETFQTLCAEHMNSWMSLQATETERVQHKIQNLEAWVEPVAQMWTLATGCAPADLNIDKTPEGYTESGSGLFST
jgi:hypothetical protein